MVGEPDEPEETAVPGDELADDELLLDEPHGDEPVGAAGDDARDEPAPSDADDDRVPLPPVEPWQPPVRRHRWLARVVVLIAVAVPAVIIVKVLLGATGLTESTAKADARLANALRYDRRGNALVLAPTKDLGVGKVRRRTWRVCGSKCDRASGHGTRFAPGVVKGGSRVELTVTGSKGATTITTPDWNGQLTVNNPPVLKGEPHVGGTVGVEGGDWIGGWNGGTTLLGLRACPTKKSGGKCVVFTASLLRDGHPTERVIPPSFSGWYVGAMEWKVPPLRTAPTTDAVDPPRPAGAPRAPLPSVTVAAGELIGPIT